MQIKESVFASNVNDLNGKASSDPPPADNLVNPFDKSSDGNVVNNRYESSIIDTLFNYCQCEADLAKFRHFGQS